MPPTNTNTPQDPSPEPGATAVRGDPTGRLDSPDEASTLSPHPALDFQPRPPMSEHPWTENHPEPANSILLELYDGISRVCSHASTQGQDMAKVAESLRDKLENFKFPDLNEASSTEELVDGLNGIQIQLRHLAEEITFSSQAPSRS